MPSHPNPKHQQDSIEWAKAVLDQPDRYVILDTETTGVGADDEVIQIGVIDPRGSVLLDRLIKPARNTHIPLGATAIHRITMPMLENMPRYNEIADTLETVVQGRIIVTYNAEFDRRLLMQSAGFAGGSVPPGPWECAMLQYSQFFGNWDKFAKAYRWQKLWGGDHTALGDCRATLARIQEMARGVPPKNNSTLNRGKDVSLTLEQFATERISVDNCMRCPRVKGKEEYGSWRYFRYEGSLTVLCPNCFASLTAGRTPPLEVLAFFEKVSELCAYPISEDAYKPAERIPLEWIEFALANLRDMTPDELSKAEDDCLREPPEGQPDQRRTPLDARKVLRVLRYIKQASEGTVTKMFGMWECVDNLIAEWMVGEHYDPYRSRVKEVASKEFLFAVNIFLSDQIGKARERVGKKKTMRAKEQVLRKAIQDVSKKVPYETLPGATEDLQRFVEFIESEIERLEPGTTEN